MIVIIDNYDSFTYNLFQYFKQMDTEVMVKRNDEVTSAQIQSMNPDLIVLSPGPGDPSESGVSEEILQKFGKCTPVLGICLGHQLIVKHFGGEIEKGVRPMHGKVTSMTHDDQAIFCHLPRQVNVTRYHSLQVNPASMPEELEVTAVSEDGVIMGVRHRHYPIEGIQFHPESILTDYGFEMLCNMLKQAIRFRESQKEGVTV
ncbi:anthranilate synthase component II [Halobacillus litoralis]|uniref:Aminodeoxychorismate/anthranilate synthase component II n=1 Tax=Halobacillus litoralis TaxID=45668 RepID=A0A410MEI8_9BACI|nr:aminodeoxychorismate/anthranilate synthase component II [Halobacillus litoralis]QAS53141.1 aminodeoxychorismate/anthranilate synthase component II [Halobacillus litoralis]